MSVTSGVVAAEAFRFHGLASAVVVLDIMVPPPRLVSVESRVPGPWSGGQAALAGKTLKDMGYANVINVGGIGDWNHLIGFAAEYGESNGCNDWWILNTKSAFWSLWSIPT